jgi:hypothetical protein
MNILGLFKKDYKVPSQEGFAQMNEEAKYTPDLWNLTRRQRHNLFVCDEFMMGLPRHSEISEDAVRCAVAFTSKDFCMWKKKLAEASFPIVLPPTGTEHTSWKPARVKGTIYSVPSKTLIKLDTFKLNGVQFSRQRLDVVIPNRRLTVVKGRELRSIAWHEIPVGFDHVPVWAYIGIPQFWEDQLDGGYSFSPVKLFTPNDGRAPFYMFTREELKDD